jgi:hypothetical protein
MTARRGYRCTKLKRQTHTHNRIHADSNETATSYRHRSRQRSIYRDKQLQADREDRHADNETDTQPEKPIRQADTNRQRLFIFFKLSITFACVRFHVPDHVAASSRSVDAASWALKHVFKLSMRLHVLDCIALNRKDLVAILVGACIPHCPLSSEFRMPHAFMLDVCCHV